jgi:hypothetical protein
MFNSHIFDKEIDNIVRQLVEQTNANEEIIRENLGYLTSLLISNKDKTPEEIIELLFGDITKTLYAFADTYKIVPGISLDVKVNNVRINKNIGFTDYTKVEKLTSDSMFGLESITKTYTAITIYELIEEGIISPNDKIKDLIPEMTDLPPDLTLLDDS